MGYYSLLQRCDPIKTVLSVQEFMDRWKEAINSTVGTEEEGYLDQYSWIFEEKDGKNLFHLEMEDWYSKHYADLQLAEFISRVIAPGAFCILEFGGEDGHQWGYYIQAETVKDIYYVRMVDGRRID